jgi:predicted  nucleic acid-binding Zn-ribbon protein
MKKIVSTLILVAFSLSSMSFVACSSKPNAEQLQALEQQKNAALAAEKTLEDRRQEISRLENELSQKKKELQAAQDELAAVKQRLAGM